VSIDALMANAGLTRGAFYSYFTSKSELYAEAIALSLTETPWSQWDGVSVDFSSTDAAQQVISAYLSRQHFGDVDASCPMVTLPSDVARSDRTVRQAFEAVFKAMVDLFAESLRRKKSPDRERALAVAGMCVGGMVVARALDDLALADALRDSTRRFALQIAGWSSLRNPHPTSAQSANRRRTASSRKL
jgi:AcrR family transcriptional regulator